VSVTSGIAGRERHHQLLSRVDEACYEQRNASQRGPLMEALIAVVLMRWRLAMRPAAPAASNSSSMWRKATLLAQMSDRMRGNAGTDGQLTI
jgi:hypothetical protein